MKTIKILHIFILLAFLTACWDLHEVNEVSIISGLAIDKGKDAKFRLTVELLNASEMGTDKASGNTASIVLGVEGQSIGELTHKINQAISRKPIYSHMKTVIISEELAREGVVELFDLMDRHREIRNDFNILIVEAPHMAADVLNITYPLQKVATQKINTQADTFYEEWGGYSRVRLKDLVDAFSTDGREPTTAMIGIVGASQKGASVENLQKTEPDAYIEFTGNSIFKDNKMIGQIPLIGSRSYLITQDNLERTSISIECEENKTVDIRLQSIKSNTSVKMKAGVPHIQITIGGEGILEGTQCSDPISSFKVTDEYEKKSGELLEEEVRSTINLAQKEFQSDIFGFGEILYRSEPKKFKKVKDNWNETFAKATVEVNATIKIRRSGLRIDSYLD
ncbi:Ger(x)C family spore germination protein [Sutcliffiella deserti]|uniref:Ger(x)C family spore germination protein n=1 Tax=Sutcliffiella deserti TaxID=2875501 RepID=UPI001CBE262D|nr:Ger(x)C family spore germination protein [Sutcliffiella deserti]